jgi:hypothetical protein
MLEIIHTFEKWNQYLVGVKLLVKTNRNNLKYFLNQKSSFPKQQNRVRKNQIFDFEIIYKKGKENQVSNSSSRKQ